MATAVRSKAKQEKESQILETADLFAELETPYAMRFSLVGVKTYFFNRFDVSTFEANESSAPGSKRRKEIDPEVLVWRDCDGNLACEGVQVKNALVVAGRYMPDPSKSGRKSAIPFIKEALNVQEEHCSFGVKKWDDIDVRGARYRNGAHGPKRRPVLYAGWHIDATIEVLVPELLRPGDVAMLMTKGGLVRGLGDNHTYGFGRFTVVEIGDPFELKWR